jgi:hypothetical protein
MSSSTGEKGTNTASSSSNAAEEAKKRAQQQEEEKLNALIEAIEEDDDFEEFQPCNWNKDSEDVEDLQQWQVRYSITCTIIRLTCLILKVLNLMIFLPPLPSSHDRNSTNAQENWDDDDIDDDFTKNLRAELSANETTANSMK